MPDAPRPPLQQQIAASIEDVKALLEDNRHLSIAFLSRRIRDLEDEVIKQFRTIKCPCDSIKKAETRITKLEQRIELASTKFIEMRSDISTIKSQK